MNEFILTITYKDGRSWNCVADPDILADIRANLYKEDYTIQFVSYPSLKRCVTLPVKLLQECTFSFDVPESQKDRIRKEWKQYGLSK